MARQIREQFGGDGAEQSLELATALRAGHRGVDELDVQVGGDLGEVAAGEVAAVVDVEHIGQTVDRPCRLGLGPDRLA